MRTAQRLAALGVVAAIVLSGCSNGKDSYSSAEKEESGQPLQSASISASSSVESAELAESANAGYPTLKEIAQNYNGLRLNTRIWKSFRSECSMAIVGTDTVCLTWTEEFIMSLKAILTLLLVFITGCV